LTFQKRVSSLGEVFRSVGSVIVQSLQKVISKLVAAVAQAAVLKGIMSLFGIGSIGGIGGSFGSILGSIVPFAEGGIVTGPTLSLIGEAGPEAVIPLDKLQQMQQGGQAQGGTLSAQVSMDELIFQMDRSLKSKGHAGLTGT
jgi:phage-related minor tail protein